MEVTQTIDLAELVNKLHTTECIANIGLSFALACIFGLMLLFLWVLNKDVKKDTHH